MPIAAPAPNAPRPLHAGLCGLAGAGLVVLGCLISAALFERNGYRYSPLACFISELGDVETARGHGVFNGALMLGALPLLYFMVALGQRFHGWLPRLAQLAGGVAAVGAFFVGVFPVNHLEAHVQAANTFFYGGMVAVFLYSIVIFLARADIPRSLAFFGVVVGSVFAAFLFLPLHYYVGPAPTVLKPLPYQHPDFWLLTFMEWLVLASVLGWVLAISGLLLRRATVRAD
jgi:hypothetical membrane protein